MHLTSDFFSSRNSRHAIRLKENCNIKTENQRDMHFINQNVNN